MKRILCPTDFSSTAYNAIIYAANLAKVTKCELILFNAQSMFDVPLVVSTAQEKSDLKSVLEKLEKQSAEVSKEFQISCDAIVEPSYKTLSTAISERARQYDLIVMGSNGADDLYQFFLGSNTYKAIVKSETPVLLIPSAYIYREINHIVYAFDYVKERLLPISRLVTFASSVKCDVTVLQVMEETHGTNAGEDLSELQRTIKNFFAEDVSLKYDTIYSSDVAQSINSYALQKDPDVLALCSVHRNFLQGLFHKSVIMNITAFNTYPVFVFH